ncbi:MAG TPA: gluconokinase [Pyrinomonadaceae bacterium]|nr:gluconokinase [Pyrinomonadaceae bacterium]
MILALDIGTSSVRAAVYDKTGERLPDTVVKNDRQIEFTEQGGAEIDAEKALAQIFQAVDEVLALAADTEIQYVAMSCFWHSLIGIDKDGNALTPVLTWADTRAKDFVKDLRAHFDEREIHNRTGARFHASYWPAKLLWYGREQPEMFGRVDKWLSLSDYLALKLSGTAVTSVSMASGTGLFDVRLCDWDDDLLSFLEITRENLPAIVESSGTFQTARWEKLKNAKWFPGIGDGAANNIGAGCTTKEKAALMIGTSGAMRTCYAGEPPLEIPGGLWCYRVDRQWVIIGGALSDGGGLYAWLKNTLKMAEVDDEIEAEIARRAPDSHGLTVMPFFSGERSTGYHENAKGAILGMTQNTTAVEIVHAAMEAVAFRFAAIFEQLQSVCPVTETIASGGALRESAVWTQIMADVLGRNLSLPDTREASSRGAVLLALKTIGKIESIEEIETPPGQQFNFDKDRHEVYRQARARHEKFYRKIIATENTEITEKH